ncbi:MAG: MoaD/ThiS family protein [Myxococcota bacterium]
MQIRVVFYGGLKERCGTRSTHLSLDEPAEVSDALDALSDEFPALQGRLDRIALAVGDELVRAEHLLRDGDELCLLPPVSGGT